MSDDASRTLFHPFDSGMLDMPAADARVLFLGARRGVRLPPGFPAGTSIVQGFRPDFLALRGLGLDVAPEPAGDGFDMALVLCGRHRGQNEAWLREALARTRPGAPVVVAGGRKEGADSLRRRVAADLPVAGHASKHHGVAFWLERPGDVALSTSGIMRVEDAPPIEGRYRAAPGMFSHDRADAGSRLLLDSLPDSVTGRAAGRVADFGAGWGYLSAELLRGGATPSALELFEADHASLEAARANLADLADRTALGFHWRDLLSEPVPRHYDLVLMNPPFHEQRAAEPAVGEGMIRAAADALKPGGRLFMVANRGLPYEKALAARFAASGEVARDDRFKVLWARR